MAKRLFLCLLVLMVLFSSGCALAVPIGIVACIASEDDNKDPYSDYCQKDPYSDYHQKIYYDISEESDQKYHFLYKNYGITLRFDQPDDYDFADDYEVILIDKDQYDAAIAYVYDMITAFGEREYTRTLFDYLLDDFFVCEDLIVDGEYYWQQTDGNEKAALISISDVDFDDQNMSVLLFSYVLSGLIYDQYGLDNLKYDSINTNGFVGYDSDVMHKEDEYLNILERNQVSDAIEYESFKAGILTSDGMSNVYYDFADYVSGLCANDDNFWDKYVAFEAVYLKTQETLRFLNLVNPDWTFEYFVELSHPDPEYALHDDSFLNPVFDKTKDYLGEWQGDYLNTTGDMLFLLTIDSMDNETGEAAGTFKFSPAPGNYDGKSGEYTINGVVNFKTGEIVITPEAWVSAQPKGYEMLGMSGTMMFDHFEGDFDRDDLTEFNSEKVNE